MVRLDLAREQATDPAWHDPGHPPAEASHHDHGLDPDDLNPPYGLLREPWHWHPDDRMPIIVKGR